MRWMMIVAVAAACTRAPAPPPARIPAPVPAPAPAPPLVPAPRPAEGTVAGGAGALAYRVVGSAPDTVIVPLGAWLEDWLRPLAGSRTLVFYDPRHRGRSQALTDSTAATFDGDVADLEAVRADLGISRADVIGFDYYAAVAAAWAARHPDAARRLVLLAPMEPADSLARTFDPPDRIARLDTAAARRLVKDRAAGRDTANRVAYCEAFWHVNAPLLVADTARLPFITPTWCAHSVESPPHLAAAMALAMKSLGPEADAGARSAGLAAPMLVIHGRQDLVASPEGAREWARRVAGARVLLLSNVGHLPHAEAPEAVLAAIAGFLGGAWPPRATPPG